MDSYYLMIKKYGKYEKINLSGLVDEEKKLKSLIEFTGRFNTVEKLKECLYECGLIELEDKDKEIVICRKYKGLKELSGRLILKPDYKYFDEKKLIRFFEKRMDDIEFLEYFYKILNKLVISQYGSLDEKTRNIYLSPLTSIKIYINTIKEKNLTGSEKEEIKSDYLMAVKKLIKSQIYNYEKGEYKLSYSKLRKFVIIISEIEEDLYKKDKKIEVERYSLPSDEPGYLGDLEKWNRDIDDYNIDITDSEEKGKKR